MSDDLPPWQDREARLERTLDGKPIRHTRYGAFVQREDGHWTMYKPDEQLIREINRPPPVDTTIMAETTFNPFDVF